MMAEHLATTSMSKFVKVKDFFHCSAYICITKQRLQLVIHLYTAIMMFVFFLLSLARLLARSKTSAIRYSVTALM